MKQQEIGVIVLAGEGFTDLAGVFHTWGQELKWPDTPERADLLLKGTIRVDDRSRAAEPPADGG